MRSSAQFLLSAVTVILALALHVRAQTFTAFSGSACDGDEGSTVPCNGACGDFRNRHSFHVLGAPANVLLFEGTGCTEEGFNFGTEQPGACINVNTGTNVQSFICG
ncbi:hypothetical protein FB45DRAFT_736239 [Roridomyces roridus]|uniref:Uncharacterized protein n=1 Tax=Roridomyces roridus TaxID=1738132 RepID=A0AAD7CCS4_9AGAR|nr:hypothetical protein FB45DRAFT_736239 [Roridomyces roridus]